MLNIAEGSSKQSDKDFNRFITVSLGSLDELIAHSQFVELEKKCEALSLQLGSLSKKLKASSK